MNKVQLGLIGASGFGQAHLAAAQRCQNVTICAILSQTLLAPHPTATIYRQLDAFLAHPGMAGVVIVAPNPHHLALVTAVFSAGKHVLVEKPLANTVADCARLVEASQQHSLILAVGHNGRRFGHNRAIKRLLETGQLGQIVMAEGHFSHDGGLRLQPAQWRWRQTDCPGGPLNLLGIHEIDTLQYLLGPVRRVMGWQRRLATPAEIPDATVTLLELESGALAYVGASYASPRARAMRLFGTQGNVRWDEGADEGGTLLLDASEGEATPISFAAVDTLAEQLTEFGEAILGNGRVEVDGRMGLQNVAVMAAVIEANLRETAVVVGTY